ncbi:glycosyltransferase family 4 protein [Acidimicrobiaceae bacterium]|nr:glycosyltransferase family 4 protein [Acidimicrobiaceae bacterium]
MKVLVTVGIFPPDIGGPATFVPKIANYFQNELNYEIDIITLSDSKNLDIEDKFFVKRIDRKLPIIYRWLKTIFTIYKLGKNKDLIFVNGLGTETTIANIFLKKKIIRKIVGDPVWERAYNKGNISENFDEFQSKKYGVSISLQKKVRNFSIKNSDVVITPSQHLKNFILNLGFYNKIETINNGITIPEESAQIFTNDQTNITIVSRLVTHKNIEKIIAAISDLNNSLIKLNIIGDGPELNQLQSIALKSNHKENIIFHGKLQRDDINNIFLNSDIYVQASNYEGLPHSLLEAMSYGIPVLCTPVGECKELLGNEDRGYELELPVSKDNIKSKINEIMREKNTASKKGEDGKIFVTETYSLTNTFSLYKNLFTNLLEEKHS